MRFHVLGVGAIGTLVSHHLHEALDPKHAVVLIHRTSQQRRKAIKKRNTIRIESNGVTLSSSGYRSEFFRTATQIRYDLWGNRQKHDSLPIPEEKAEPKEVGPEMEIQSLIVTTKAYSVVNAIRGLIPRITPNTTIVLLHNGMGVYEKLLEVFQNPMQRPNFIVASNTHGAWTKEYFHTVHSGHGEIVFGIAADPLGRNFEEGFENGEPRTGWPPSLDNIAREDEQSPRYISLRNTVAALSNLPGLSSSWQPISHVLIALKRKLVVNSVINPLTALLGCRNGDILESRAGLEIIRHVCSEAAMAFAMEGPPGQGKLTESGVNEEIRERKKRVIAGYSRLPPGLTRQALEKEVIRVAKTTSNNISSMLTDARSGSYTEIDFMNGYLVGLGRANKLSMTTTSTLMNLVKLRSSLPADRLVFK